MSAETSPAGEADSSNDPDDKTFACPTCDGTFDSLNGRNVHHYQKHGESLAWETYTCYTCDEEFERRKCEVKDVEKPVCSFECRKKVISEAHTGERNHKYKDSIVNCSECGAEIEVQPVKLETQEHYYCDQSCYGEWLSKHNYGEAHHQHKPDKKNKRLYGTKKWKVVAAKVIERDGSECQYCFAEDDLLVHHIHPVNDGGAKYDMDNLVTLCRSCHMTWEGLWLRPDTR